MRMLKLSLLMTALLVSAVALLGIWTLRVSRVEGQANGPKAAGNGDVNCDGRISITDAVSLLHFLFRGGEPPCALAQEDPGDSAAIVKALGSLEQTLSSCCRRQWPPRPEDIVNLRGFIPGDQIGQGGVIFTVPEDRWLVVTDARLAAALTFVERRGAEEIEKPFSFGSGNLAVFHFSVGLTFAPGSEVVVRHVLGSNGSDTRYNAIGYLTDA
ncbi:MAG: hypothetical protein O7J95_09950 [Planctomycetota bacterium]|nr:hypothetical protein [Planctomycetota bacterium]